MGGKGEEREGAGRGRGGRGLTPTFLYPPPPLHTITNRDNFHFQVSNHQLDFINVLVRRSS